MGLCVHVLEDFEGDCALQEEMRNGQGTCSSHCGWRPDVHPRPDPAYSTHTSLGSPGMPLALGRAQVLTWPEQTGEQG